MGNIKIPKRITSALLNSLGGGVAPRVGLEHVVVGRKNEVDALFLDFENISHGGAVFRFIIGKYGSGKSFLLQLIRNYARDKNFVIIDADLAPERRLIGTNGQGLATYRELMKRMTTKTKDEDALTTILDRWFSNIASKVSNEEGIPHEDHKFDKAVASKIHEEINKMQGMVHGFDFSLVLAAYWRGYRDNDDNMRNNAIRWLKGEFSTKSEASSILRGVKVIVDDNNWYDYLKIWAKFVTDIGYQGLLIIIDEAVNLFKITNSVSRQNNYEKLLSMFNDTMQGKAEHLGFIMAGTSEWVLSHFQWVHCLC